MDKREDARNAGFGIVGVVLIVVAVALIGFIGWRVYDASKAKPTSSTQQQTSSSQSSGSGQPSSQPPSGTPTDTATYLNIKELGVRIKLDDSVKDATYSVQTLSDGSLVARFSTQSLAALDPSCDAKSGQLGALEKSTASTDRLGNELKPDGHTVFKFGNYYYTYATSQALCSSRVQSTVNAALTTFRQSLTTLQTDN